MDLDSEQSRRIALPGVLLFSVSIFASAFLLFMVQPMVGKHILPWFGGAPGVWMLCLAFYQSTLFLGYAYAHLLLLFFEPRWQFAVHAAVFAAALAVLPVLPGEAWKPDPGASPSLRILAMLIANVALPFFLLASTGPLVQWWFARVFPGRSPYPLYAVSNIGSLLALVSYPFLVEPRLTLSMTSSVWSWGMAAAGVSVCCCAWWATRKSVGRNESSFMATSEVVSAARVAGWVLFPACAVVLLMGVTNQLCLDVASVPFLWIIPLCIYLVTFILCFASERVYRRNSFILLWVGSLVALIALLEWDLARAAWGRAPSLLVQIAIYALMLFGGCMLAHGELYRSRPAPRFLTRFYLCVSGGGALGGLFVGLAAPRIFQDYHELPIGAAACWLLVLWACWRDPASFLHAGRGHLAPVTATLVTLAVFVAHWTHPPLSKDRVIAKQRNFFGVLEVLEAYPDQPRLHQMKLRNGSTMHGVQHVKGNARREPVSYFGRFTGIGLVMGAANEGRPWRVGVIGLGIGTLAAYGRSGDRMVFYELDPDVVAIAQNPAYFSYLHDSAAEIEVVPGDARLSLEAELRAGRERGFDLLVIDAFNSDAIPVHLLTLEAFQLYQRHLRTGGALAVHVSNRHFDLTPLVFRLGRDLGLRVLGIANQLIPKHLSIDSWWLVLSEHGPYLESVTTYGRRQMKALGIPRKKIGFGGLSESVIDRAPVWTDDYSDLFSLLKRRRDRP
jgi:hypothetical protein